MGRAGSFYGDNVRFSINTFKFLKGHWNIFSTRKRWDVLSQIFGSRWDVSRIPVMIRRKSHPFDRLAGKDEASMHGGTKPVSSGLSAAKVSVSTYIKIHTWLPRLGGIEHKKCIIHC